MSATHKLPAPRVGGWIRQRLIDDATVNDAVGGRIFRNMAPAKTPFPYVIYQLMASESLSFVGGVRLWDDDLFLIKVVDANAQYDVSGITPLVDRVDDLFHDQSGTFDGVNIWTCQYERTIDYVDDAGFVHLGAEYRMNPGHSR